MNDDVEELIKEIAARHGIAVSRDDPILILQTVNKRLLEESAKAQQTQLVRHQEALEDLATRWGNDAKNKAERILNASLFAGKETMHEGAKALAAAVRAEIDLSLAGVGDQFRDARRLAIFNVVAACLTLAAAGVVLWVFLRTGAVTVQALHFKFL